MKRGFFKSPKSGSKPTASLSKDIIKVDRTTGAVTDLPNRQREPPPSTKIKMPSRPADVADITHKGNYHNSLDR